MEDTYNIRLLMVDRLQKNSFPIKNDIFSPTAGDKTIPLVEDGCTKPDFASTSSMDRSGLKFTWEAFKFKTSNFVHFTV